MTKHLLRPNRIANRKPLPRFAPWTIAAEIDGSEPARTIYDLDALHGEALKEDAERDLQAYDDLHLLWGSNEPVASWEWALIVGADMADPEFDEMYGAYVEEFHQNRIDEDGEVTNYGDPADDDEDLDEDEPWMLYASIEQCRDIFGGTDFLVVRSGW